MPRRSAATIKSAADRRTGARRCGATGCSSATHTALLYILLFLTLTTSTSPLVDVALAVVSGLLTGYLVLQYADVRAAYAEDVAGRAFAVFNTVVFQGVAHMQWATGFAASLATAEGADPLATVFIVIAGLLGAGIVAFTLLPWPSGMRKARA